VRKLLMIGALVCCAFHGAAAQPAKDRRPSPADGKVVYMRLGCYTCHGTVGHGGAGARLATNTLPLAAFQAWVRNGTPGWTISRGMPAFSAAVVTDEELADVRAYLAELPAPPAVQDVPLLN
jgi:ubiquinol-cytochrome c reductase cytochrome c subunit